MALFDSERYFFVCMYHLGKWCSIAQCSETIGSIPGEKLPVQSLYQEFYVRQESEETHTVTHRAVQLQMQRVWKGV